MIGGGAAGLMAAITAARQGAAVTLLEPNERLGKKVNITGKGRCNVTNDCDRETLLASIPGNGRFLYGALTRFTPRDTMAFFEALGVPLKVERGNRVFPVSDSAFDITNALERELKRRKVRWARDRAVSVETADGAVCAVTGEKGTYPVQAVILATGGVSYPGTGSTGDGYRIAEALGHTIVPPRGSLVPLVCAGEDCPAMQGLSLRNVAVTVYNGKKKAVFRDFGELLFTHFGVSGPLVLSASAHLRRWEGEHYTIEIDLKPALDEQKLDARVLRDIGENPNREMGTIAAGLVPHSMAPVVLRRSGLTGSEKANSLTKEQRRALVQVLKHFTLELTGPRPVSEAIVTAGGVKVGEVTPNTMASKRVRGLYFAGEVLDVDAYTGGFNLQIAWATGYLAGLSAAESDDMTERQYAVAIDGPSGAGKSTLARAAAEALHILYVDTGAIYRTIGVYMYRHDIAPTDAPAVIAALPEITVALRYDEEGLQRMYLNGEDVTKEIRLPMISKYASDVSAIPEVRAFLMELQRSLAREHSVIMDGRDIGTVVLPDAEVKVFLCADVETRARRRFLELEQRGTPKPFDEVLRDMEQRDYNDTHRAAAPLRPADDAIMIDNTDMDFAASLELLLDVIRGRVAS